MKTRNTGIKGFIAGALVLLAMLLSMAPATAATFKIATLAPDGTAWMKQMRAGAEEIERRTAGRVSFKFYPGGVMGNDKTVRRKIRIGQLQGGALTGGIFADVYPDSQLYSLPLVFRGYPEMDYVRAHMDQQLVEGLEKSGFVTFGLSEGGFAYLMSKETIRSLDDLKSRKVWVPEGDMLTRTVFENMGITPIPLPIADVYTGLQTGLIDTVGISPIGAIAFQWHTQVKYVVDTPLMYIYGVMAIDRKAFNRLKPEDRKIVREVMGRVFASLNKQNRADNKSAKQALRKQGLEFVDMTSAELKQMRTTVAAARKNLDAQGLYTKAAYKTMLDYLDHYRQANGVKIQ
jgi:TRAP-type C4-dicarboxylate transport system substrate-binding protein